MVSAHTCPAPSAYMLSTVWRGPGRASTGPNCPSIEPLHAQRGSHPNGSVGALGHGCHRHGGQALCLAEDRHRIALKPDEAVSRGRPTPCHPVAQTADGWDARNFHSRCGWPFGSPRNLRRTPSSEAAHRLSLPVADDGPHQVARGSSLGAVYHHASGGPQTGDAVGGAEPDVAGVVLLDGTDAVAWQPFAHGAHGHAILFEAVDAAAGGSHPNAAFGVFVEASNDLVGEPVAGLVGC